jgi:hypothetical protein
MALSCMRCPAAAAGGSAVVRRAAGPSPPPSSSLAFSFARCGRSAAAAVAAAGWRIDAVAGQGGGLLVWTCCAVACGVSILSALFTSRCSLPNSGDALGEATTTGLLAPWGICSRI